MQNVKIECTPLHISNFTSEIVAKCLEWSWSHHVASQISGKSSPSFHADMPLQLHSTTLCHNAHFSTPEKLGSAYSTFNWCYWYGNWRKTVTCVVTVFLCICKQRCPAWIQTFCMHYYPSLQWHCYMWILFVFGFPAACTGWHTGVGRFSKKNYSVDIQLEMDLFVQK